MVSAGRVAVTAAAESGDPVQASDQLRGQVGQNGLGALAPAIAGQEAIGGVADHALNGLIGP